MQERKRIAAIVTVYRRHSHADVIVGKILEGYSHRGREFPRLQVVSMYVDQFPDGDMSRALARRHGFRIYPTIEAALTLGGRRLAVDGVLSIGEHGNYPLNRIGQRLYPRRRFFERIMRVFAHSGRSVPVFNDKHLSTSWNDALWMYQEAKRLRAPFMAGSSLPVTWRRPSLQFAMHSPIREAVQIGYGGIESYGFHALEALQCMMEYRRGGESGVASVQFLDNRRMWAALDRGDWSRELLEAALAVIPGRRPGDYRRPVADNPNAGVFLIRYRDGVRAAVAMLNGLPSARGGNQFAFAARLEGQPRPAATHFFLQDTDPYAHFAELTKAIETMIHTQRPAYPVERTLLTTGILETVMISKSRGGPAMATPHLDVRYQPSGWPPASGPVPPPVQR